MEMIEPGRNSNFRVDFTPKIVYATLYDVLKQFRDLNINNFQIEIYGYTVMNYKSGIKFNNTEPGWTPETLDLDKLENLFAVLVEHENDVAWFNVIFWKA